MFLRRFELLSGGFFCGIEGDDNPGAGGPDGAAADPGAQGSASARDLVAGGDGGGGTGGDAGEKAYDWRASIAGGDEAFLGKLKRFSSEANFGKSYREMEKLAKSTQRLPSPPPENASAEEIADYRKQVGVPETPDGYGLKYADDFAATDADNGVMQFIANSAHAQHWTPAETTKAFGLYQAFAKAERQAQADAAVKARAETQVELQREYRGDHNRNMTLADEWMVENELDQLYEFVNPKTGRSVLHSPDIMKRIVAMARAAADPRALVASDVGGGGKSAEQEYNELIAKSQARGGPRLTAEEERKLLTLKESMIASEERAGRRRAAA